MIHVDFHADAEAELEAAVSFYESVMTSVGKAFVNDLDTGKAERDDVGRISVA